MKLRHADLRRRAAGWLISPLVVPALVTFYGIFVSGYGRQGGYGSEGVRITATGFRSLLFEYILPATALSYVLYVPLLAAVSAFLKRVGALTGANILLIAGLAAPAMGAALLVIAGPVPASGFPQLAGLFAVPSAVVSALFVMLRGLPWGLPIRPAKNGHSK